MNRTTAIVLFAVAAGCNRQPEYVPTPQQVCRNYTRVSPPELLVTGPDFVMSTCIQAFERKQVQDATKYAKNARCVALADRWDEVNACLGIPNLPVAKRPAPEGPTP